MQKPYKQIDKTDKTDPETTMAAAASEAAIVVSGSVLSVLSIFLYVFLHFQLLPGSVLSVLSMFCMVFAFFLVFHCDYGLVNLY